MTEAAGGLRGARRSAGVASRCLVVGDPRGRADGRGRERAVEDEAGDAARRSCSSTSCATPAAVAESPHDPLVVAERLAQGDDVGRDLDCVVPVEVDALRRRADRGTLRASAATARRGARSTGATRRAAGRPRGKRDLARSARCHAGRGTRPDGGPPGHVVSGDRARDDVSPPGPPGRKIMRESHREARRRAWPPRPTA